jgi:putative ABC transport system ATP-binding protein
MVKLNEELKTTFLFATHDEKVIGYLKRKIYLKDGLVDNDEVIKVNGKPDSDDFITGKI